jgi:hypothetical protein
VSGVELVDSTWIGTRPSAVAAAVADPANWTRWWPTLALELTQARGGEGVRWSARSVAGPGTGLTGSAEVWLEPANGGVVAHFILRLAAPPASRVRVSRHRAARIERHYRVAAKRAFWSLGDHLDAGRTARLTGTGR